MTFRPPLFLLAVCAANIALFFVFDLGMDLMYHFATVQCFSEQFWEGDLYPRWCFSANFSFGSPHLLIYYPFAYYVTALLYPLHALGLSLRDILVTGAGLATLVTALGARRWLSGLVGARAAAVCAAILLFMPYRQEVMFYRFAVAELWCFALAPWVLHYTCELTRNARWALPKLALCTACMVLSCVPPALGVLLCAGIYVVVQNRRVLPGFVAAVLLALVLASPYWLPALAYVHDLDHDAASALPTYNSYVTAISAGRDYMHIVLASVALTLCAWALCVMFLLRRVRGSRVAWVWAGIGGVCIFLLFPVSSPFWNLVNSVALVGYPWRMQLALSLAIVALGGLVLRLRQGDIAALLMLQIVFLPVLFAVEYQSGQEDVIRRTVEARAILASSYRPLTAGPSYYDIGWYERQAQRPRVEETAGHCRAEVTQWSWRGIGLRVQGRGCSLRLHHLYFPVWQLQAAPGVRLSADSPTGLMRLDLPPGESDVWVRLKPLPQMMREGLSARVAR